MNECMKGIPDDESSKNMMMMAGEMQHPAGCRDVITELCDTI